jgi:ABC-type sugar transport system ATPase subunit
LEAQGITKSFPGVLALDHVDFTLKEGEVHALVGENGAGKSTLMQILSGVYSMNSGEIFLNGVPVEIRNPVDAQKLGIGIVFQELSLIPELSVAENMYPNRQPAVAGFIRKKELYAKAREIIDIFQETIDPATPVKYLTIAKQQMVEIMKVLSFGPRVLILDEPTSSLTQLEADRLFATIKQLQKRKISIIYISHHLPELFLSHNSARITLPNSEN